VKEYWVVNPQQRPIEIYSLVGQTLKLRSVLQEQDDLTSSLLPGFSCKVEDVFRF